MRICSFGAFQLSLEKRNILTLRQVPNKYPNKYPNIPICGLCFNRKKCGNSNKLQMRMLMPLFVFELMFYNSRFNTTYKWLISEGGTAVQRYRRFPGQSAPGKFITRRSYSANAQ